MTNETNFLKLFKAARRTGTPIIAVRTSDYASTIASIKSTTNGSPLFTWDIVRGVQAISESAEACFESLLDGRAPSMTTNPIEALTMAASMPSKSVFFVLNAHRIIDGGDGAVAQGIWNLRDQFKSNYRVLCLLAPQLQLPSELKNDVLVLDEPLPTNDDLAQIVRDLCENVEYKPSDAVVAKAVDATCGLSAFSAEQVIAMSITKNDNAVAIDLDSLWERKRQQIEQTPGLTISRVDATAVAGLQNFQDFMTKLLNGPMKPGAIVLLDEIGDAMAGNEGDNTGVSQDIHGAILSFMETNKVPGVMEVGVPGVGKSYGIEVIAKKFGIPFIKADIGAMKDSKVGASEARVREFMKVAQAMSGGKLLFVGTTNSTVNLSPQLMSRFRYTFFYDIPTVEGRAAAWAMYMKQYSLTKQTMPDDDNWTPREIRNCCEAAYALGSSLVDAAKFIVPVYKSGADDIAKLRAEANGKYLDADRPGFYQTPKKVIEQATEARKRSLDIDGLALAKNNKVAEA